MNLNLATSGDAMDYAEDYWVGPIPPDYSQVNEKTVNRKAFEPAKFEFVKKSDIKAKVSVIIILALHDQFNNSFCYLFFIILNHFISFYLILSGKIFGTG